MLFYGKEIDIFYIILFVILILVVYILFSFYTQQKQTIALTTSSQPILSAGPIVPIPIQPGANVERGAFAISLWINITSWVPPTKVDASFNVLSLNNATNATTTNILTSYVDASCNLFISSTLFIPQRTYQITPLPIKEPINIILNYNGDDDYNEDEGEFLRDSDGNIKKVDGKPVSIYNTDTGFIYNNRALDVFVNGRLNTHL